jgi:ABC-type hemin transport system ATPase subunit
MVIKLTNVSKVIKKAKVLDNVNLELTSGKVYGLKGKNGSGKTMPTARYSLWNHLTPPLFPQATGSASTVSRAFPMNLSPIY